MSLAVCLEDVGGGGGGGAAAAAAPADAEEQAGVPAEEKATKGEVVKALWSTMNILVEFECDQHDFSKMSEHLVLPASNLTNEAPNNYCKLVSSTRRRKHLGAINSS
eukprot:SAG22_NODE_2808_length_2191_cov_1.463671_3_plen_107_part_00